MPVLNTSFRFQVREAGELNVNKIGELRKKTWLSQQGKEKEKMKWITPTRQYRLSFYLL